MRVMAYLGTTTAKSGAKQGAGGAASGEGARRRFNTEDISAQLLRMLQPLHVDSLSLHDQTGELLWLNEGAFGPDEHGVVLDALDVFALDTDREDLQLKLDDDRSALVACARDTAGEVVGIALAIVETPAANEESAAKLGAPRLSALMRRLAQLLVAQVPKAAAPAAATAAPVTAAPATAASTSTRASASTSKASTPAAKPEAIELAITVENRVLPERRAKPSSEKPLSREAAGNTIHARRYARLRAGGVARRYEVKAAPDASFAADLTLTTRVLQHLKRSGDRYTQATASFAVPLSVQSITQDGWLAKLQPILERANLGEGLIGFSLPPAAWDQEYEATGRFLEQCEAARCFVALDDFTLLSSGIGLLRSSAVKCLKLEPKLVSAVVHDKFSHAVLASIMGAARVLGLYCVAKQVSSASEAKWLAAAGIEFADGVGRGVAVAATRTAEVATLPQPAELQLESP